MLSDFVLAFCMLFSPLKCSMTDENKRKKEKSKHVYTFYHSQTDSTCGWLKAAVPPGYLTSFFKIQVLKTTSLNVRV